MEFQVDSFGSTEETNAYMSSHAFASNPIGVQFDPEELAEQFRERRPHSALGYVPRRRGSRRAVWQLAPDSARPRRIINQDSRTECS